LWRAPQWEVCSVQLSAEGLERVLVPASASAKVSEKGPLKAQASAPRWA